jgi:hypothetical protein
MNHEHYPQTQMSLVEIAIKLDALEQEMSVRDRRIWLMSNSGYAPYFEVPNGELPSIEGRGFWLYAAGRKTNPEWPAESPLPYKGVTDIGNGWLCSPFSFDITGKQDFNELERVAKQAWCLLYERITGQGSRPAVSG